MNKCLHLLWKFAACAILAMASCTTSGPVPEIRPAQRLADPLPGDNLTGHWYGHCSVRDPLPPQKLLAYQFHSHKRADGSMLIEFLDDGSSKILTEEGRWTRRGKLIKTLTTRSGTHYTNPDIASNQDSYDIEKESPNEVWYRDQRHGILFIVKRVPDTFQLTPAHR